MATSYTPQQIKAIIDERDRLRAAYGGGNTNLSGAQMEMARRATQLSAMLSSPAARAAKDAGYLSYSGTGYTYNPNPTPRNTSAITAPAFQAPRTGGLATAVLGPPNPYNAGLTQAVTGKTTMGPVVRSIDIDGNDPAPPLDSNQYVPQVTLGAPNPYNLPYGDPGRPVGTTLSNYGVSPEELARRQAVGFSPLRTGGLAQVAMGLPAPNSGQGTTAPTPVIPTNPVTNTPISPVTGTNSDERISGLIKAAIDAANKGQTALLESILPQFQGLFNSFQSSFGADQTKRNGLVDSMLGRATGSIDYFNGLRDTSQGLSPETMAALRTQAIEDVPGRFDRVESDLMTSLRRAAGGGGLPSGGEFVRGYGPLQAAKETTRAGLLRDVTMANEAEKIRTGDANKDRALQAAGLSGSLAGTMGQLYDPARYTSGLLGAATGGLNTINSATSGNMSGLGLAAQLTGIGADMEPGSFKNLLLASLLGSASKPGGIVDAGVGKLFDWLFGTGEKNEDGSPKTGSASGAIDAMKAGGTAVKDAVVKVGGAVGSGLAALFSNPYAAAAAAVAAGGLMWLKSQAHWEANTMVQKFENPYHFEVMAPFVREFTTALSSGNLTKAQATTLKEGFAETWTEYQRKATDFGKRGSDEKTVSDQSIANLKPTIEQILRDVDAAIGLLA